MDQSRGAGKDGIRWAGSLSESFKMFQPRWGGGAGLLPRQADHQHLLVYIFAWLYLDTLTDGYGRWANVTVRRYGLDKR